MARILKCTVAGVDYSQYLVGIDLEAPGVNAIGTATLHFDKQAAGLVIPPMAEVKVWEENEGGTTTFRYFGGFAPDEEQGNAGNEALYDVTCQDYNVLLDTFHTFVYPTSCVEDYGQTTFQGQIEYAMRHFTRYPDHLTLTSTIAINNSLTGSMGSQANYALPGASMRKTLDDICRRFNIVAPSIKPGFFIGMSATGPGVVPELQVFDTALYPSPVFHFTDNPGPGIDRKIFGEWHRTKQGDALATRVEVFAMVGSPPEPFVVTGLSDSGLRNAQPNPYDFRTILGSTQKAWQDPPIEYKGPISPLAPELTAVAENYIAARENRRETITFDTNELVLPGQVVRHSYSLYGLSNISYRIVSVSYDFTEFPSETTAHLTLGALPRELGEGDLDDILPRPREVDIVGPDAVPSVALKVIPFGEEFAIIEITHGRPGAADLYRYAYHIREGTETHTLWGVPGVGEDPPQIFWATVRLATGGGVIVQGFDTSNNPGVLHAEVLFTAEQTTPIFGHWVNGNFAIEKPEDDTLPFLHSRSGTGTVTLENPAGALKGKKAVKLQCSGLQSATLVGPKINVLNPASSPSLASLYKVFSQIIYDSQNANGLLSLVVQYYSNADVVVGLPRTLDTVNLGTGPTKDALFKTDEVPPNGAAYLIPSITLTTGTGVCVCYVVGAKAEDAVTLTGPMDGVYAPIRMGSTSELEATKISYNYEIDPGQFIIETILDGDELHLINPQVTGDNTIDMTSDGIDLTTDVATWARLNGTNIATTDWQPLCFDGEIVFFDGDVVMTGVPS